MRRTCPWRQPSSRRSLRYRPARSLAPRPRPPQRPCPHSTRSSYRRPGKFTRGRRALAPSVTRVVGHSGRRADGRNARRIRPCARARTSALARSRPKETPWTFRPPMAADARPLRAVRGLGRYCDANILREHVARVDVAPWGLRTCAVTEDGDAGWAPSNVRSTARIVEAAAHRTMAAWRRDETADAPATVPNRSARGPIGRTAADRAKSRARDLQASSLAAHAAHVTEIP